MGHLSKEKRDKLHTGPVSGLKFKVTGRLEELNGVKGQMARAEILHVGRED